MTIAPCSSIGGSPLEGKGLVLPLSAQEGSQTPGLHLDDGADLVAFALIHLHSQQPVHHPTHQGFSGLRIQHALDQLDAFPLVEVRNHRTVHYWLAKFFNKVEDQRGFPRPIDMEKAGKRLQPSIERAPHTWEYKIP